MFVQFQIRGPKAEIVDVNPAAVALLYEKEGHTALQLVNGVVLQLEDPREAVRDALVRGAARTGGD